MNDHDPATLTHEQLAQAPADQRTALVEAYLLALIRASFAEAPPPVDASSQLADIGIDSIQIVELKFGLDQVLGQEVDVELIIGNPTVHELAATSVAAAGL